LNKVVSQRLPYKPPPVKFPTVIGIAETFGKAVIGVTQERMKAFEEYRKSGMIWKDLRKVVDWIPILGSGLTFFEAVKDCMKATEEEKQCDVLGLVMAGAMFVLDVVPGVLVVFKPILKILKASRGAQALTNLGKTGMKFVLEGLGEVAQILRKVVARELDNGARGFEAIREVLERKFKSITEALTTCVSECTKKADSALAVYQQDARLTLSEAGEKVGKDLEDDLYKKLESDGPSRVEDVFTSVSCLAKKISGSTLRERRRGSAPKNLCPTTITTTQITIPGNPTSILVDRVEKLEARLDLQYIGGGTDPTKEARKFTKTYGTKEQGATDQAGHILAYVLGGSGGLKSQNITPILSSVNGGVMAQLETRIANMVRRGSTVDIKVELLYKDAAYPLRPSELNYTVIENGISQVVKILNPLQP
jgi:DNA/RNA non-specific endonuclease